MKNFPESWTADMHEEALCQICRVLGDRVCTVQIHGERHVDIVLGGRVIICGLRKQTRLPHRCLMQRKLDNARKRKPPSNSCAFNVTVWSLTSGDWNNKAFLRYSILNTIFAKMPECYFNHPKRFARPGNWPAGTSLCVRQSVCRPFLTFVAPQTSAG